MTRILTRPAVAFTVGALVVAAAFAGRAALASEAADATEVHACAQKSSGQMRYVASASDCKDAEQALTWSVLGPVGPQGPEGPQGPTGPQGEQGEQGEQGAPGEDGTSVTLAELPVGDEDCPHGGVAVSAGDETVPVCTGERGPAGPTGQAGPPGGLTGLTSANGIFRIEITDYGIVVRGPRGRVVVDMAGARVSTTGGS